MLYSYYDDIPGVQLLHCVQNDVAGGENGFVDGFNVCQKLKESDPKAFETLTKTRITFHKIDKTDNRVKLYVYDNRRKEFFFWMTINHL